MLHAVFYLFNRIHSFLEYLVHISLRVTRSVAFELALVDSTDKLVDNLLTDTTGRQPVGNILTRQLLDRDVQFVADITPEGTEYLVVERRWLVLLHQARGFLQSLRSHLVGTSGTLADDICILDGALTEDDEQ